MRRETVGGDSSGVGGEFGLTEGGEEHVEDWLKRF